MSEVVGLVNRSDIENIADAIRNKTNSENTMLISEMADIISDIEISEIMTMPDYEEIINPDVNTYYGIHKENYVYGYAMTQANYDLITPETTLWYTTFTTANNEVISTVVKVTQQQYEDILAHDANTLYVIEDSTEITDVMFGDIEVDNLYRGSNLFWSKYANMWKGTFNTGYYWSQSNVNLGQQSSDNFWMASQYYFLIKGGSVYHYEWTKNTGVDIRVIINQYDSDGTYISTVGDQPVYGLINTDIYWTVPNNCKYWTITYRDYYSASPIDASMVTDIILQRN